MKTVRLTMAQALVRFLQNQLVERDGAEQPFFAGCWGIFGHGNVAGIGQALHQYADSFPYYQTRNEQAMVHTAVAYARMKGRLQTFACASSIGPGATNMLTAAAGATINRLPVLLLPGDIFAERIQAPVLQQVESENSQDLSVNDCFKPVSKYWDRIYRPEQLITALPEALRVLTSPADTGAVTLALPQDTQTEAYDYPVRFLEPRVWHIQRNRPDLRQLQRAAALVADSERPLIVAGGGVHYSDATDALRALVDATRIPVGETQAGKGSLPYDHPSNLGALGVTGTFGANRVARDADVVIGVGTRYTDFTTASKTAFRNPHVRFVNINVAEFDAGKLAGIQLTGDARVTLEELQALLGVFRVTDAYGDLGAQYNEEWDREVQRIYDLGHGPPISQGEVIGVVNTLSGPRDVVVCAAGSMPGDLHKLWRTRDPKGYHVEYGYSTMGYEIAGGLGVKMADRSREVYVLVGDGSYLMMNGEIATMAQEHVKVTIIVVDNHGFASIGGLSESVGAQSFGTEFRHRSASGHMTGTLLPIDYAANAASLGAVALRARSRSDLANAIRAAQEHEGGPVCIVVETDRDQGIGNYESWWDVPVAEVGEGEDVQRARREYEDGKATQRHYL